MKRSFLPFSMGILFLILVGCAKEEQPRTEEKIEKVETMVMKVTDPVCDMEFKKENAIHAEYEGKTYYFCSEHCKEQFLKDPQKYSKTEKVVDPVCDMSISMSVERTVEHKGETYYFCSSSCKDKFEDEPEKYIGK